MFATVRAAIEADWVGLAKIVNPGQVNGLEDDADFDYEVRVPKHTLLEVEDKLIDLSFAIQDRYGIKISALPIGY